MAEIVINLFAEIEANTLWRRSTLPLAFVGVSDALDRLTKYSGERGSLVIVTERLKALEAITCEVSHASHPGGSARGVALDEPDGDTPWLLWMLANGWSSPIMAR